MTEEEILAKYSTPGLKRNRTDQKTQLRVDKLGRPIFDKDPPKIDWYSTENQVKTTGKGS